VFIFIRTANIRFLQNLLIVLWVFFSKFAHFCTCFRTFAIYFYFFLFMLKTRGIILRTIKYGETSVITDIFTEEKGLRTFIAGSVRTARTRMPFGLFQPMRIVELVSYFRESAQGPNRLKEIRPDQVFSTIPFDVKRGSVALFMAEICRKCIQNADEQRELFQYLCDTLTFLDTTPHPVANIHLHFLMQLSACLGFFPIPDESRTNVFLDFQEGSYIDAPPLHSHYLGSVQTAQLVYLWKMPLEFCHEIKLDPGERKNLLEKLLHLYRLHIPGFGEVHTTQVLETVF
jgi:DNA repair protein RecO (recombination protein O)